MRLEEWLPADRQFRALDTSAKVFKLADPQSLYVMCVRICNIGFRCDYRSDGARKAGRKVLRAGKDVTEINEPAAFEP